MNRLTLSAALLTFTVALSAQLTVTDYNGNVYQTVQIGDQVWMSENLKTTHYSDGTAIPLVEGTAAWDALAYAEKAYCYYDNSNSNRDTYGALYTWAAAMNGEVSSDENPGGIQGVCPSGWHLPSDSEWKELEMFLGMSQAEADATGWRGTDEGGKMKEAGTTQWNSPNNGATNLSGFTALPGGDRNSNGDFAGMSSNAYFWSSAEDNGSTARRRALGYDYSEVYRFYDFKDNGLSVRCIKDSQDTTPPLLSNITTGEIESGTDINATSNEKGVIYLVASGTGSDLDQIRLVAKDSIHNLPAVEVYLSTDTIVNGAILIIYAVDSSGNISIPSSQITVLPVPKYDLALQWISPDSPECGTSREQAITVQISNPSTDTVFYYSLSYSINNGLTFTTENVTSPVAPGESDQYTFDKKADMSGEGPFDCIAAVFISDDVDMTNDTSRIQVLNHSMSLVIETSANTCRQSIGVASVAMINGGTAPYSYIWTSGDTTAESSNLTAGVYEVIVTDASGCSKTGAANITDTGAPQKSVASSQTDVTCYGGDDGSIDLAIIGGIKPITYKWSNGITTQDISNLTAGPYEVIVIGADTCSNIISFDITEPEQMDATTSSTDASCGVGDGTASIIVTGGMEPYSYLWPSSGTDSEETGLSGGIYTIVFQDANGCSDSSSVSVNEIGAPVVTLRGVTPAVCGIANGGIDVTATGGAGSYQFLWSNAAISEDLTNVPPGDYSVQVAYTASSCNSISTFTIPSIEPDPEPICMVSVDSATNSNMIVWEKPVGDETIQSYMVYRETSAADIYQLAEIIDFASESLFIDSIADPRVKPWRYKISILDTCGNESELSELHKTIHLTMNVGLDGSVNLIWGNYLGFDYSTYNIYRYNTSGEKTSITGVAGSQSIYFNTYTDLTPPADVDYYVVELQGQNCTSGKKAQSHNTVRSNKTKRLGATGIYHVQSLKHLSIYPNPNKGVFTLSIETVKRQDIILRIFDAQGKLIQSRKYDDIVGRLEKTLDLAGSNAGLYHLQLIMKDGMISKSFIID